jgi:formate-dependent nitrite reductase membrane component NrfD
MDEITITGADALTYPHLATWGAAVAAYLFLGGLVAGIMVVGGGLRLRGGPGATGGGRAADLAGFPLLLLGLLLLWVDLENRWNAWRLYTTFQLTSPMSWGSWIVLLALVVLALRFAAQISGLATGYRSAMNGPSRLARRLSPTLAAVKQFVLRRRMLRRGATFALRLLVAVGRWARRHDRALDALALILGLALGLYTGVLLSSMVARPLWNSAALAPLFLASGLAGGAALLGLALPEATHRRWLGLSLALGAVEFVLIVAYLLTLAAGSAPARASVDVIVSGAYSLPFWGLVVLTGLVAPAVLEGLELRRARLHGMLAQLPVALTLAGSMTLRFVIVYAGMRSSIA